MVVAFQQLQIHAAFETFDAGDQFRQLVVGVYHLLLGCGIQFTFEVDQAQMLNHGDSFVVLALSGVDGGLGNAIVFDGINAAQLKC